MSTKEEILRAIKLRLLAHSAVAGLEEPFSNLLKTLTKEQLENLYKDVDFKGLLTREHERELGDLYNQRLISEHTTALTTERQRHQQELYQAKVDGFWIGAFVGFVASASLARHYGLSVAKTIVTTVFGTGSTGTVAAILNSRSRARTLQAQARNVHTEGEGPTNDIENERRHGPTNRM